MTEVQYKHLRHELWTPLTPEVVELIERAKKESGMTWDLFSRTVGIRARVIRRYRDSRQKRFAIPLSHLDRILTGGDMNRHLRDLPWYTADEMVDKGYWKPQVDVYEMSRRKAAGGD